MVSIRRRGVASLALALALPVAARAAAATVSVTVDDAPDSTRIVLTHTENVEFAVEGGRRKITVLYATPVRLEAGDLRPEGPLLESLRQRDPREIVIETGPRYETFESFELRNPFRLIIDLRPRPERPGRADRPAPPVRPQTIVVLDPGHGGVEQGAIGPTGLREKDVALALARRLRLALQQADPSISVVLTRDEDRAVGLDERTAVANHNRAALFVSIHLNASPRADAVGAETYYLSTDATDDEARTLAAQENYDPAGGGAPDGIDLILWDLAQNRYLAESSALAESMQDQLNRLAGTRNRGVRQAPFRVLMGATMPAVLVEAAFITNPAEEAKLRSPDHMNQIVEAMTLAVREFLGNLAREGAPAGASGLGPGRP
jgi:N-acetylmuramoyl-L-alanine amidase